MSTGAEDALLQVFAPGGGSGPRYPEKAAGPYPCNNPARHALRDGHWTVERRPFEPGANGWSSTLQKHSTAVVVIYSAAVLHITEALIVANTTAADNSIPIASLLAALRGHRLSLDIIMVIAALLALAAASIRPGPLAIFALIPQQTLLVITAIGAFAYACMGHYADGYEPSGGGAFIFADQLPRVLFAIAHGVACYQWLWFHDLPHKKRSTVESILARANRVSLGQGQDADDDLLVLPVDELREIVETHL